MGWRAVFRRDRDRYPQGENPVGMVCTLPYRLAVAARNAEFGPLSGPLGRAADGARRVVAWVRRVELSPEARIGAGFRLVHGFGVVVPAGAEVGENCSFFHGVTLGEGPIPGMPRLGDSVAVFPGVCILGGVTIGDDVEIGPNNVVMRDIPSSSVVPPSASRVTPACAGGEGSGNTVDLPSLDTFLGELRADWQHYAAPVALQAGFWVTTAYRLRRHASRARTPLRFAGLALGRLLDQPFRLLHNVDIPTATEIGAGLKLPRPVNIVMGPATVGRDCVIEHDVTFGLGVLPGLPRVGDRVRIGCGAKLLGGITIGDDVVIGANCVVVRDIPAASVVSLPDCRAVPRASIKKIRAAVEPRRPGDPVE